MKFKVSKEQHMIDTNDFMISLTHHLTEKEEHYLNKKQKFLQGIKKRKSFNDLIDKLMKDFDNENNLFE